MKLKALALAAALFATSAHAVDWKEHPYDKLSHVAIGGALSCAVTQYTKKPLYGVLSALAVGLVKESVVDENFDRADMASWGAGGLVGAICIKF